MKKDDLMYYLAYLILFILLGVWMLMWAVNIIPEILEAIVLWLFSAGVLMMIFGTVKTKHSPRGSSTLLGAGIILSIITLVIFALMENFFEVWVAVSVAIILIGIGGLGLFLARIKGTIEE